MTVVIKRNGFSTSDLRQAAARCDDSAQARRALALALILDGKTRAEAAESIGMDRQTCATGCIGIKKMAWKVLRTAIIPAVRLAS